MNQGRASVNHSPARRRQPPTNRAELKRRRIEAGLSITGLAREAGCSKGHLSDVESRGEYNLSPELLGRIADVLGCSVLDLVLDGNGSTA